MSQENRVSRGELIEENRRLRALVDLCSTLADARLSLDAKLTACVETLGRLAGAERTSLMMVEGQDLVVRAATNPEIIGLRSPLNSRTISTDVVQSGKPIFITDVGQSDYASARREGDQSTYRTNSLISVPLCDAGTVTGVLNLSDKLGADAFDRDDFRLARTIAGQISALVYFSALHSRLVDAFNELDKANQVKADLMSMILHGLKAPLTGAKEMVRLAAEDPAQDPAEQGHRLDLAESELELLWRRITNLLDLSRMEAEEPAVNREPVNLASLASEARDTLAAMARGKGVKVWLETSGEPTAMADEELTERIVVNLLLNALQVSSPGAGGRGEVTIQVGDHDQVALLEVIDSGPGVDPARADEIFEPAGRVSPEGGSPGQGLRFSRRAARLMHGDVRFDNLLQGGARFSLTLPAARRG